MEEFFRSCSTIYAISYKEEIDKVGVSVLLGMVTDYLGKRLANKESTRKVRKE